MAAIELSGGDSKKQEFEDMTTCCICTETFTDPKTLPCSHTFCMRCLQKNGLKTNKGPGDEMPCPICRQAFKIPPEGFHGLLKNFFIERLIQMSTASHLSAVTKVLCSVCVEESEGQGGKETPTADMYCVDCKHKLCEECCNEHRKFKVTKNHKLIPINEQSDYQHIMGSDQAQRVCEVHEQKVLNVYCVDCKTDVDLCAICFTKDHIGHKGSCVDKYLNDFRKQIQDNIVEMNKCISKVQTGKVKLVGVKVEMQEMVERLECDIEKRKEAIKQLTDKHASNLLQGLCCERQSKLKEIQMATNDIDACLLYLETFNSFCEKVMNEGPASDICRTVSDLSVRAFELRQQCQPIIKRGIQQFKFHFRQSELEEFVEADGGNLIGEIKEGDFNPKKRSLLAEQSSEIDRLRRENEIQRTEKESMRLANEQLKTMSDKEAQGLREELIKEKSNYKAHLEKLKQELDNNMLVSNALQKKNEEMNQRLNAEKMTQNDKLTEEIHRYKEKVKTLESNTEKLRMELKTSRADNRRTILTLEHDMEEQRKTRNEKKEQLVRQSKEQYRSKAQPGKKSDPVLVQTIITKATKERKKDITGLAILDNELYVVSQMSSYIEIYDLIKVSFIRRSNLTEMVDPKDIGSNNKNKCLYILDYKGRGHLKEMLIVDPSGKLIKSWSTGNDYGWGLSVTYEWSVIFAVCDKNKLNEYSPDGQLIREITLSADAGIRHALHAVKLTNGDFVVSHGDDLHRVCIIDANGKLKKSFGGKPGSTTEQINLPFYLSVDGTGFVMVSDQLNHRVLLLDSELQFQREVLSKRKHGLQYPERILLDESNGRLFVADNDANNQRLLVFNFR